MHLYGAATASVLLLLLRTCTGDTYHAASRSRAPGGFRNEAEADPEYWAAEARLAIAERRARASPAEREGRARNAVLFLGDGMSVATLTAARALLGQRAGAAGEAQLSFEAFPAVGLAKTYCVDAQVPDSACTATAYLCGAKANLGTLGVDARVQRGECERARERARHVDSLAAWALASGLDAGLVTTTRVTHASPAGAYSHSADRDWECDADVAAACPRAAQPQEDIALQLVHSYPGNRFKVILGGGRREFLPNTTRDEEGTRGRRTDRRDLIQEWRDDKAARNLSHAYVWHAADLRRLAADPPEYLLGLFEGSHLQYHMEADPDSEPTLAELTEVAIESLSRNEKGFFLFVEGGRIDHAHHDNYPALALDETIELSAAVARAASLLSEEDSLIVVTSDHAHVMSFSGYSARGTDILGPSDAIGDDGVPYMTLSYANGPGARAHEGGKRPDVTGDDDFRSLRWRTHADVPLGSETHGGDDVGVFARGVAHGMFSGLYEQSQLPHLMAYAACIGPGPHICDNN